MTTISDLGNLAAAAVDIPAREKLGLDAAGHPPRILILYGSLRPQSYSRKLALEAERLLRLFGAETRVFHPHGLPLLDSVGDDHPQVRQLREWRSEERRVGKGCRARCASGDVT